MSATTNFGWLTILAALAMSPFGMGAAPAVAQATASARLCAARDVEVVTLIEDHGEANDIAAEQLAKAGLAQMQARFACSNGRDGIALYNDIIRSLGPMLARRP